MKIKLLSAVFFLLIGVIFSCRSQINTTFIPIPDSSYSNFIKTYELDIRDIIETKDGTAVRFMPQWLRIFLSDGIEAVERLNSFNDKYVFIGINEGDNFFALDRWVNVFFITQDFSLLAAERIERRMIRTSFLYPDDEYGPFFEKMVKNAYDTIYQGIYKEDTYWVKLRVNNETIGEFNNSETYVFFMLISMDKHTMQDIITDMITQTINSVNPTGSHIAAINRLRQNFFEGF